jgi:hypothetical protein
VIYLRNRSTRPRLMSDRMRLLRLKLVRMQGLIVMFAAWHAAASRPLRIVRCRPPDSPRHLTASGGSRSQPIGRGRTCYARIAKLFASSLPSCRHDRSSGNRRRCDDARPCGHRRGHPSTTPTATAPRILRKPPLPELERIARSYNLNLSRDDLAVIRPAILTP